jgi:hypothetical protein
MTAVGADPAAGMKYAKIIGEKEKAVESFQANLWARSLFRVLYGCTELGVIAKYLCLQERTASAGFLQAALNGQKPLPNT